MPAVGGAELRDDSLALARFCAQALDSRKLGDVKIFDVRSTLQICDYFVIASGASGRQLKAAGDYLDRQLADRGIRRLGIEGYHDGHWVLLDYDFVVVHLFHEENRRFYDLELLWGDSPPVTWNPLPTASA